MKNSILSLIAICIASFTISGQLTAQSWTNLGSAKVNGYVDHDQILVTAMEGDFTAIKLFVENAGIQFERVVVTFGNGGKEEMILRDFIPAGGETRVMDLRGRDRVIRKVDFYYKSNPNTKKKAKVVLFGRR